MYTIRDKGNGTIKDIASAIPIYITNQTIDELLKLLKLLFFPILVNSVLFSLYANY